MKITLQGVGKNKLGVGAKVKVTAGGTTQTQELLNTRGYQSSVDFNLIFGIGKSSIVDQVEVIWPNQKRQTITKVAKTSIALFNPKNDTKNPYPMLFYNVRRSGNTINISN